MTPTPRGHLATGELSKRGALGTVAATVANVVVLYGALAAFDIPDAFEPLQVGRVVFLTLLGGLFAVLAYALVQRRSGQPARTFVKVAAVALVVSWVPDVLLLVSEQPGATTTGVTVLMVMHAVAAALIVGALTRGALPGSQSTHQGAGGP